MSAAPDAKTSVRDAATVILWREGAEGPEVLMGQRGGAAAFMPNKVVFPGGAVDPADAEIPLADLPGADCLRRLAVETAQAQIPALLTAAIRELWEETGLILGAPGPWERPPPPDWEDFAATGHRPAAGALRYVFRAVTPPGRPRRFDARFFLAPAEALAALPEDLAHVDGELRFVRWIPLARVREADLPFITSVVLAEIGPLLAMGGAPASVPFVVNDDVVSEVRRLR